MKTLITILALSLATAFSAHAQVDQKMSKDAQSVKAQTQKDMAKQIQNLNDRMTKDLNLTADQSKKVMAQNKKLYSDMASMKTRNMKEDQMMSMKRQSVGKYDAALKKILKDDQYKKYTSMKANYMKMMGGNTMPEKSDKMQEMHK